MVPGLLLALLVISAAVAPSAGYLGAAVLGVVSVLWLSANGPMEGRILVTVSRNHGFTAGDLAGVAGLLVALWCLVAAIRS